MPLWMRMSAFFDIFTVLAPIAMKVAALADMPRKWQVTWPWFLNSS